jgi:hypothetical protein
MSQTQLWTDRSRWPSAPPVTATTLTVRSNCGKSSFKTPSFHVMKKNASNDPGRVGCHARCSLERYCLPVHSWACLALKILGLKTEPSQTAPPFPFTKTIFQWDYSCRTGIACTVVCPGGEVDHVVKLSLYLGTVLFDGGQNAPAVFYEMNTREYPHASGFSISPGLTTLSCQVNGMTLNYSGPPK